MTDNKTTPYWFHRVEVKVTLYVQSRDNAADIKTFFEEFYNEGFKAEREILRSAVPEVIAEAVYHDAEVTVDGELIEVLDEEAK